MQHSQLIGQPIDDGAVIDTGARESVFTARVDDTAETDGRDGDSVDAHVRGEHVGGVGSRTDEMRGPAGSQASLRDRLRDQAGVAEVFDECLDGAAVEAHQGCQLGTGQLSLDVDLPQQRADVAASDLVLRRS